MQTLKNRFPQLTERTLLLLLMTLTSAFFAFIFIRFSQGVLSAFLFPWAIGMAYTALRKHEIRKSGALIWSCLSIAAFTLSGIVTKEISGGWGYGVCLLIVCTFFLLSPPRSMTAKAQHDELLSVAILLITLLMPFAILAMISVFTGHSFRVPFLERCLGLITPGNVGSRVRIYTHANITARFAVVNILFCIYAICRIPRKSARVYFGLNFLLNTMLLAHTQSRTCIIALAAGLAVLCFRFFFLRSSMKGWRIPVAILAAAISFVLVLEILDGLYKADVTIARALQSAGLSAEPVQSRADTNGQFDIFNSGRNSAWLISLRYLLENPRHLIFGLGSGNIIEHIAETYPAIAYYQHLHNSLLECLAHYGLPYLISILGFLCCMIAPTLRVLLTPNNRQNRGIAIIPVMIGVLLIMSIPEKMLFINADWTNLLFYFCCGHVLHSSQSLQEENA